MSEHYILETKIEERDALKKHDVDILKTEPHLAHIISNRIRHIGHCFYTDLVMSLIYIAILGKKIGHSSLFGIVLHLLFCIDAFMEV